MMTQDFERARDFAIHIKKNQGDSKRLPEFVLENCAKEIDNLSRHLGQAVVIDEVWGMVENARLRQRARTEIPVKRMFISANYADVFLAVGRRDGFGCAHCGNPAPDLQIDHCVPLIEGGTNDLDNLQLLCARCNIAKSDR